MVQGKKSQRIGSNHPGNFLHRPVVGNEIFRTVNVRAIIAGGHKGGGTDPHMNFLCSCQAQLPDNPAAGGTPDNGIVNEHHPFPPNHGSDGIELDVHAVFPLTLAGSNEGSSDIFVLGKADGVGDSRLGGIPDGRLQAGVRHADDHIRFHRMLHSQKPPRLLPGKAHAGTVHHRIRPGKVDILKYAQAFGHFSAMSPLAVNPLGIHRHHLAGSNVPDKFCSHRIQGTGLRGKADGPFPGFTHAQRAKALGISGGDKLGWRGNHQTVCPFQPLHSPVHCIFYAAAFQPLLDNHIGNHLGVGGGMENGAPLLQLGAQGKGVGQIAVMGQGHAAFVVVDYQGLDVDHVAAPGGGIAHMAYHHVAPAQSLQFLLAEHLVYQAHAPAVPEHPVVIDHDARTLLSPVLQSKQPIVCKGCHIHGGLGINAKDTTLFVNVVYGFGMNRIIDHGQPAFS